jgi:hypothetical protein
LPPVFKGRKRFSEVVEPALLHLLDLAVQTSRRCFSRRGGIPRP